MKKKIFLKEFLENTGRIDLQIRIIAGEKGIDKEVKFGLSTLERWYYRALGADDPVSSLERKVRSDRGKTPAISSLISGELESQ